MADIHNDNRKKTRILSAATELFSRYPYHRVAMDSIARKANVAKGTLYYHFSSKEQLYASLLRDGLDTLLRRLEPGSETGTSEDHLKKIISELIAFFNENREFFVVLHQEEAKLLSGRLKNCYEKICTVKDLLIAVIAGGMENGAFRPCGQPDLIAEMILGMIKAPVIKGRYDAGLHAELMADMVFHGLKGGLHG